MPALQTQSKRDTAMSTTPARNPPASRIGGTTAGILVGAVSLLSIGVALATDDIIESARVGCQTDIDAYCESVIPGEGRVLERLTAAHHELISARCNYALDAHADPA
jgi:hypothetical protein